MERDISICIPARNEEFLARTVQDILENKEANTEIIVGLDSEWANPCIPQHPDVNVIFVPETVGQRGITDLCVKLSRAKYIIKCDAHCSFDKGFDRKMLEMFKETGDNVTAVPTMRNLWVFDWKCGHCGWKKYQGPTPEKCDNCGKTDNLYKKMVWVGKERPQSNSYAFDAEPHFIYFNDYTKRPEYKESLEKTGITETMSLQGSFFMATREKYWELGLGGDFGSWGNQGLQVACATWLSGGRVLVNHKTWYSHCFRTQGGSFGFPYEQHGRAVDKTKKKVWEFFINGKWDKQIHSVSWLVEKFWPVPGWTQEQLDKLR